MKQLQGGGGGSAEDLVGRGRRAVAGWAVQARIRTRSQWDTRASGEHERVSELQSMHATRFEQAARSEPSVRLSAAEEAEQRGSERKKSQSPLQPNAPASTTATPNTASRQVNNLNTRHILVEQYGVQRGGPSGMHGEEKGESKGAVFGGRVCCWLSRVRCSEG